MNTKPGPAVGSVIAALDWLTDRLYDLSNLAAHAGDQLNTIAGRLEPAIIRPPLPDSKFVPPWAVFVHDDESDPT